MGHRTTPERKKLKSISVQHSEWQVMLHFHLVKLEKMNFQRREREKTYETVVFRGVRMGGYAEVT
jgi:hypothetical protein